MFDFEWTHRRWANDADEAKGVDAAERHCEAKGIDAESAWKAMRAEAESSIYGDGPARDAWNAIEAVAISAMCEGWAETPVNVSLIWR